MAVEAARDCLRGRDRGAIDLLLFASTTGPFAEKQGAAIIAAALALAPDVRTVDVGSSLRGGTQALLLALDAVRAGSARSALVVVADCREGAPGSALEAQRRRRGGGLPGRRPARRWSSSSTARARAARSSTCGAATATASCTPGKSAS